MNDTIKKYFDSSYGRVRFPVQVIDKNGKVIFINEAFTLQWGFDLAELEEYNLLKDSYLRESGASQLIKETFEDDKYHTFHNYVDSLLINRAEAAPILRTNLFRIEVNDDKYVVLLHEDQTEQILAEEEIKKARDSSKESERLKTTFLNVLSHELRTPLNIILGYSSIIRDNLSSKLDKEDKIYLDNLHSGSERLFKSITQMLEFAQLEAGSYELNNETLDLVNLFKLNISHHKKLAEEKNLKLRTNISQDNIYVDADRHCIEGAFNNLLNNAIKFTHHGFVEVELNTLSEKELAVCKIRDSGVGISSEYLDHLYSPFSQEELNVGRNFEGNGLGLALSKRYIEKSGGSLLVDSIKGVGSTFTFTIPLTQKPMYRKAKPKSGENLEVENTMLMIDDSGESFELLSAFLKNKYSINNFTIRDFKLEMVSKDDFSMIIFDVNKNYWQQGIIICKDIIRNDPFKRPLIIISSEYLDTKIKEFYDAGASKFLVKPFSKSDLISALNEIKVS